MRRVKEWRGGLGRSLFSPVARPFVCGCPSISAMLRFHSPLIEPDVAGSADVAGTAPARQTDTLHTDTHRASDWPYSRLSTRGPGWPSPGMGKER
jgi:hypothetical protein